MYLPMCSWQQYLFSGRLDGCFDVAALRLNKLFEWMKKYHDQPPSWWIPWCANCPYNAPGGETLPKAAIPIATACQYYGKICASASRVFSVLGMRSKREYLRQGLRIQAGIINANFIQGRFAIARKDGIGRNVSARLRVGILRVDLCTREAQIQSPCLN